MIRKIVGSFALEATLQAIKTVTDMFNFTGGGALEVSSGSLIPVAVGVRNDHSSGNVGDAAATDVELIASTSAEINRLEIFDSSGKEFLLMTGVEASETEFLRILPGGNGQIDVLIAAGTRLVIRATSGDTIDAGVFIMNTYG